MPDRPHAAIDWVAQPWGDISDREIGRRIGRNQGTVSKHRRALGIPARDWTKGIDWDTQPLGQMTDLELARRLGLRGDRLVQWHRRRRGIPAFRPRPDWSPAEEQVLTLAWGYQEPEKIAARLPGRTPLAVIAHARKMGLGSPGRGGWTEERLAKYLGVSWWLIRQAVRALRIRVRRRPHTERGCRAHMEGGACHRPFLYNEDQADRIEAWVMGRAA